MRHLTYSVIILSILSVILFFYKSASEKNVVITTTPDAFLSVSIPNEAPEINSDGMYFFLDITPAPWPKEAKEIYDAIKSNRAVKVVVIKQDKSSMDINFLAGLSEKGHLRVKVKSREEENTIMRYLFYGS